MSTGTQTFRGKLAPDTQGLPFNISIQDTTSGGGVKSLASYTVPVGYELILLSVDASCGVESTFLVEANSAIIASKKLGPANLNAEFIFRPYRVFESGDIINLKISARRTVDTECYLQARLKEL